jgi:hypothetical protein
LDDEVGDWWDSLGNEERIHNSTPSNFWGSDKWAGTPPKSYGNWMQLTPQEREWLVEAYKTICESKYSELQEDKDNPKHNTPRGTPFGKMFHDNRDLLFKNPLGQYWCEACQEIIGSGKDVVDNHIAEEHSDILDDDIPDFENENIFEVDIAHNPPSTNPSFTNWITENGKTKAVFITGRHDERALKWLESALKSTIPDHSVSTAPYNDKGLIGYEITIPGEISKDALKDLQKKTQKVIKEALANKEYYFTPNPLTAENRKDLCGCGHSRKYHSHDGEDACKKCDCRFFDDGISQNPNQKKTRNPIEPTDDYHYDLSTSNEIPYRDLYDIEMQLQEKYGGLAMLYPQYKWTKTGARKRWVPEQKVWENPMKSHLTTVTGREISLPEQKAGKILKNLKIVDKWLVDQACLEAESRADDWNLSMFKNLNSDRLTPAERDGLNLYLFGQEEVGFKD